jgi:hypothetical protein
VQNFLDLDDLPVTEEGEPVHAQSIISLPFASGRCVPRHCDPGSRKRRTAIGSTINQVGSDIVG